MIIKFIYKDREKFLEGITAIIGRGFEEEFKNFLKENPINDPETIIYLDSINYKFFIK